MCIKWNYGTNCRWGGNLFSNYIVISESSCACGANDFCSLSILFTSTGHYHLKVLKTCLVAMATVRIHKILFTLGSPMQMIGRLRFR